VPNLDDREPTAPIPAWGYVAMNAVAAAILYGIWHFAFREHGQRVLRPQGMAPLLVFVWLCFLAASVYDAMHDRIADRMRREREAERRTSRGL
jgi:hypothetical protein